MPHPISRLAFLASLLLLLLPGRGAAQQALIDSLNTILRTAPADSTRVKAAMLLAIQYSPTDSGQTRRYLGQGLLISRRAGYRMGEAQVLTNLGTFYNRLNQNARAQQCYQQARELYEGLNRQRPDKRVQQGLAVVLVNEGTLLAKQGNFPAEARAYLQAAAYAEQLGDQKLLGSIYTNLGYRFQMQGQPTKALYYWQQAATLQARTAAYPELLVSYINLADHHLGAQQLDSAWRYLRKAEQVVRTGKADQFKGEFYGSLGQYYLNSQNPRRARQTYATALSYARQKQDHIYEAKLHYGLGAVEIALGNYRQARPYLAQSLRVMQQIQDTPQQADILTTWAELEEKDRNFPLALRYFKQAHRLQDSLATAASKTQINQLENQYQAGRKEQQIKALRQGQQLQRAELQRQRALTYLFLTLAGALLLAGVLALLVVRYRQQRQHQHQQAQQRQIASLQQERQLLATEAMLRGQEEERSRLARDLHDGLGGMLSTVKLYLGTVRGNVVLTPDSAQLFARSLDHLDSSIQEMRRVARNLMPEALLTFGLPAAVRDLCETTQHSQPQLQVECQVFGLEERLPQRTELVIYRLVQELLNNVLKHADARQVIVQIVRHEQQVQVVVEDDGRGFDLAARPLQAGVGLRSVQARVDYLGGTLELQSQPAQGTSVNIEFELQAA